ncbi:asparaginase [Texcoconibacillus texcoconensis]|uniref:asparaginase n=1 Tax=Texcoconibacillus texcoconensis TaxID=1095777 RepID=A0A840QNI9_9BACI|nr:asparaginase [Texcoconibacillus texcoconensis]MBB5172917.1 L-asparaginase [Texcoconibacillus texcoconensis]
MKKVAVLTTGGTIASKKNDEGRLHSGALSGEDLSKQLQLPEDIKIDVYSMAQKPSMHMTFVDYDEVVQKIEEITEDDINGIVITHGTDSLEEAAYYFDLTVDTTCPIVVTGSQRAPGELGSDALINLRHAVHTACSDELKNVGTVVVFNERIFAAKYVKKEHASNIQGFNAFGFGYLGIIDNDKIQMYQRPIKKEVYKPKVTEIPKVDIVKTYLGADELMIQACIKKNVDGIVIEGVGRGQVTPRMMSAICEAIEKGIVIVITTSSEEGEVYTTYDYPGSAYDLYKNGVVLGRDYDSKKARIKLMTLIRAKEDVKKGFQH